MPSTGPPDEDAHASGSGRASGKSSQKKLAASRDASPSASRDRASGSGIKPKKTASSGQKAKRVEEDRGAGGGSQRKPTRPPLSKWDNSDDDFPLLRIPRRGVGKQEEKKPDEEDEREDEDGKGTARPSVTPAADSGGAQGSELVSVESGKKKRGRPPKAKTQEPAAEFGIHMNVYRITRDALSERRRAN